MTGTQSKQYPCRLVLEVSPDYPVIVNAAITSS
jgi:hypothetical protein